MVAHGTPAELKRIVPGGHITLRFTELGELESAARTLGDAIHDEDDLTLQIPSDGGFRSLRALIERLDQQSIEVEALTVHTPDLDDVFLAITGRPTTREETPS